MIVVITGLPASLFADPVETAHLATSVQTRLHAACDNGRIRVCISPHCGCAHRTEIHVFTTKDAVDTDVLTAFVNTQLLKHCERVRRPVAAIHAVKH